MGEPLARPPHAAARPAALPMCPVCTSLASSLTEGGLRRGEPLARPPHAAARPAAMTTARSLFVPSPPTLFQWPNSGADPGRRRAFSPDPTRGMRPNETV